MVDNSYYKCSCGGLKEYNTYEEAEVACIKKLIELVLDK